MFLLSYNYFMFFISAFSDYNTEQFTPAKVGENQVGMYSILAVSSVSGPDSE